MLAKNPLLQDLPPALMSALAAHALPRRLRRNALLWEQGQPVASLSFVIRGRILVQKLDAGGCSAVYQVLGDGDVIGHEALLDHPARSGRSASTYHAIATARETTTVLDVATSVALELARAEPLLLRRFLGHLHERFRMLSDALFEERVYRGKYLLAAKLLRLASMEGARQGRIYLRYSQEELSHYSGLGLRNLNTFLHELPGVRTTKGRRGVDIDCIATLRAFLDGYDRSDVARTDPGACSATGAANG